MSLRTQEAIDLLRKKGEGGEMAGGGTTEMWKYGLPMRMARRSGSDLGIVECRALCWDRETARLRFIVPTKTGRRAVGG